MPIQGYKSEVSFSLSKKDFEQKSLPVLAAISVASSKRLTRFYYVVAALIAIGAFMAWLTFSDNRFAWGVFLMGFSLCVLMLCIVAANQQAHYKLWFEKESWWIVGPNIQMRRYEIRGAIVCWADLVIIPLASKASKDSRVLLIFQDAVCSSDWHRLRIWVRSCLKAC